MARSNDSNLIYTAIPYEGFDSLLGNNNSSSSGGGGRCARCCDWFRDTCSNAGDWFRDLEMPSLRCNWNGCRNWNCSCLENFELPTCDLRCRGRLCRGNCSDLPSLSDEWKYRLTIASRWLLVLLVAVLAGVGLGFIISAFIHLVHPRHHHHHNHSMAAIQSQQQQQQEGSIQWLQEYATAVHDATATATASAVSSPSSPLTTPDDEDTTITLPEEATRLSNSDNNFVEHPHHYNHKGHRILHVDAPAGPPPKRATTATKTYKPRGGFWKNKKNNSNLNNNKSPGAGRGGGNNMKRLRRHSRPKPIQHDHHHQQQQQKEDKIVLKTRDATQNKKKN